MSQLLKNVIPNTGREVTKLGFGGYRVSKPIHAQALKAALEGGVNIIDTGNNFENGIYIFCDFIINKVIIIVIKTIKVVVKL